MVLKIKKRILTLWIAVTISGISFIALNAHAFQPPRGGYAWEITVEGQQLAAGPLSRHGTEEVIVPLKRGEARVIFAKGSIEVKKMPKEICPKGICSEMGPISKPGEVIICMPNKMLIRIFEQNYK